MMISTLYVEAKTNALIFGKRIIIFLCLTLVKYEHWKRRDVDEMMIIYLKMKVVEIETIIGSESNRTMP